MPLELPKRAESAAER